MSKNEFHNDMNISFENCCVVNGNRWFFINELNALCCMNENNEIVFKGVVPGENDSSIYLFADIKYLDDKIFLIPRGASALVVYDIKQDSFRRYEMDSPSNANNNPYVEYLKFSIGVIHGEKLYMIPRTYPAIVVFDTKNETLEYETSWINMINDHIFEGEAFFWADYSISDDELVLASANSDCIVRRSFITNEYSSHHIDNENKGFSGIEIIDDRIFLCSRKDGQILYVEENGQVNRLHMPDGFKVSRIIGFSKLIKLDSYLYAIPLWANYFVQINLYNYEIKVLRDYDIERRENTEVATCCAWVEKDKICIDNNLSHEIDIYSEQGFLKTIRLDIDSDFRKSRIEYMANNGEIIHENKYSSLEVFLNCLG